MINKKFYELTPAERLAFLVAAQQLDSKTAQVFKNDTVLPANVAAHLSENQIGYTSLPLGIVPEMLVNQQSYVVPLTTEEPSVVAAASNGAKLVSRYGGFKVTQTNDSVMGQLVLSSDEPLLALEKKFKAALPVLKSTADNAYPSIVKRGGGVTKFELTKQAEFMTVNVFVDTKDAMGANIVNTILEALMPEVTRSTGATPLMAILSNQVTQLVTANCSLPIPALTTREIAGEVVATKIAAASRFATLNEARAITHNKGIMNGIEAIVLATGNDTRAVNASVYAYASQTGQYQPLSTWKIDQSENRLVGTMTIPLHLAIVGGGIAVLPTAKAAIDLLKVKSAQELAQVTTALGLAQNLAALKALVTTGIQAGHMKLQANTLALAAGATPEELPIVVARLVAAPKINQVTAEQIITAIRQEAKS